MRLVLRTHLSQAGYSWQDECRQVIMFKLDPINLNAERSKKQQRRTCLKIRRSVFGVERGDASPQIELEVGGGINAAFQGSRRPTGPRSAGVPEPSSRLSQPELGLCQSCICSNDVEPCPPMS